LYKFDFYKCTNKRLKEEEGGEEEEEGICR
jgi:hypothetical protein